VTSHSPLGTVTAVVVTYYPDDRVIDNLSAIALATADVIVVDNGSDQQTVDTVKAWAADNSNRCLIELGENLGLAAAQNRGIDAAIAAGASWIWLFDDDSRPAVNTLTALARAEAEAPGRFDLLAPRIRYEDGRVAPLTLRNGRFSAVRRLPTANGLTVDPVFVIASGSLIRAEALRSVGAMREEFFIDYVDVDFCLRLGHTGRHSAVVGAAVLDHRLGAPTRHQLLGSLAVVTSNHSIGRRRFMTRNRARLWREWSGREPGWVVLDVFAFVYQVIRVALFENDRRAKLHAIGAGLWRGLFTHPRTWSNAAERIER
jgi:GT2 family glycosyltransferase